MPSHERGVALLEVLTAIAILAIAAVTLLELAAHNVAAIRSTSALEHEWVVEENILASYALLPRSGLDLRLGLRDVGPFVVNVQRPERTLYRVAVSRAVSPTLEDLVTVLYRPEPRRGR